MELVIAMAMVTIIFAVVVPQFVIIRKSWDAKQGLAEALQNGRVLMEHVNRNLSKAKQITAVSTSSIEFTDCNNVDWGYGIGGGYVQYGPPGNLEDLAGPVSTLTFTCYDACDFSASITEVNDIRVVKVDATFTNSAPTGQDKTFSTWAYLRVNANTGTGLVGCWKLDETDGITAADSSGNGLDGTLVYMNPPACWVTGQNNGAIEFDGANDYVDCGNDPLLNITDAVTIAFWVKTDDSGNGQDNPYVAKGDHSYAIKHKSNNNIEFFIYDGTWYTVWYAVNSSFNDDWHHLAGTYDGSQLKLYIDGEEVDTANHTGSIDTTAYSVNIGRNSEITSRVYEGMMDDVRIYDRALTAEEIAAMADILRYRDFRETQVASDTASITITTPDTDEGDLLIAAVATDGGTTFPEPTGWTEINQGSYNSAVTLGAWWKLATASEPLNHTFTWTGGNEQAYGWIMRFTGHDSTSPSPINGTPVPATDNSQYPTSPEVSTTVNNCLILRLGAFDDDDVTTLPEPGDPGLSGHTPITMDESAASGLAAVEIVGSWVSGTTHAKETGSNRALVFFAHAEDNDNPVIAISNPIYYGDQAMTPVIEQRQEGSTDAYVVAYVLDEAGIAAASGTSFSVYWNQSPDRAEYYSVFLQNVNQSSLIGASDGAGVTNNNTITTAALSTSNGDMVLEAATSSSTGTFTAYNGFTKDNDFSVSNFDGMNGHKSATGASETPSVRHSDSTNVRHVLIGFVVQGAGAVTGTVSGGAGYVRQADAGDSGTSTFTLGSSKDARMLTIAIAPADNEYQDCCPEVQP